SNDDIVTKYNYLEVKKRIYKTELIEALRLFKRFNIIETIGDITSSSIKIIIYPSILYAINTNEINAVYEEVSNLVQDSGE
ncbi:MAG: hypothetical protein ACRC5M_07400, partial [Anaeroplasmataceae bacterium]